MNNCERKELYLKLLKQNKYLEIRINISSVIVIKNLEDTYYSKINYIDGDKSELLSEFKPTKNITQLLNAIFELYLT